MPANARPEPPLLPSIDHLIFSAPLYKEYSLGSDLKLVSTLYDSIGGSGTFYRAGHEPKTTVDGYCRVCEKGTPFLVHPIGLRQEDWNEIEERVAQDAIVVRCPREPFHTVTTYFLINAMVIQKIGQYPSFSDIVLDETQQKYKTVLKGDNAKELKKAIALAAHGEGIGAFVYLRRVFERLVHSRFKEAQTAEGWTDQSLPARMEEKVLFLKDHLPAFLVESRRMYSIFSAGVHELDNDACLGFFDIGKESIIMILQDDLKKQEEAATRRKLGQAIASFEHPKRTKS